MERRNKTLRKVITDSITDEQEKSERDKVESERDKVEALARIQRLEYMLQVLTRGERKSWTSPK